MSDELRLPQLIVIGSSAGGIEALSTLVSTLLTPFPTPILVAQHLDPSRPSHLGEILTRRSQIPVVTVTGLEKLQPGTLYLVPSDHHMEVTDHQVKLVPDGAGRPKPSIDLLLSSASKVYGERLVAVILTGTGSDGAMGARAVKEAGGTVIIQNPETAAFPGMPQAIEPHVIDIISDLSRISSILYDLVTGAAVPTQADARRELAPFLEQLHKQTGIDFSSYKTPTILRRLQRRIIAVGASDLASYKVYLEQHAEEYQRLASSFLIKVTDFMRDADLFDTLRDRVIPDLIAASRKSGNELRLWSAGCATGQEPYSLAILIMEALGDELPDFAVKIFATDLDSEAIAFARRGLYLAGTLSHMPEELVARYFTRTHAGFEVKKQVRSLLVFGEHDLAQRAPFPRIDMVLCRNVLIYFARELQQRALQLFAFSLREGGYLVLGKTEAVSLATDSFVVEMPEQKIYRRYGRTRALPPLPVLGQASLYGAPSTRSQQRSQRGALGERAYGGQRWAAQALFSAQQEALQNRLFKENLLHNLPVGVVVVDRRYDIQEINGAARLMLGIHSVALGEDLVHLAQRVPAKALRAAIDEAFRQNHVAKLNAVQTPKSATGDHATYHIECYPQPHERDHDVRPDRENNESGTKRDDQAGDVIESVLVVVTDITDLANSQREIEQNSALLSEQADRLRDANAALTASIEETRQSNIALDSSHLKASDVADEHTRQLEELAHVNQKLMAENKEMGARHTQEIEALLTTNRELLDANQEVTRANRDVHVMLDELLVSNDEAQAAVEEVETLNEEMQASNEELETLNEELQATVEELNTSNADLAARGDELQDMTLSLEAQKVQLEAILSGLTDAVLVVGGDGAPQLVNDAYTRLFGETVASLPGGSGGGRVAKRHKHGVIFANTGGQTVFLTDEHARPISPGETPQARAARGETFTMNFALVSATGEERRYLEAVGQPVSGSDGQRWGVVVIRDITERSLRIMQEQFTSLANHELSTPLTTIKGYLQMIESTLKEEEGSERALTFVGRAIHQANRQMRLLDDLLDVARIQSDKFTVRAEPLRLDILVAQVAETAQVLAQKQKIQLTIEDGVVARDGVAETASGAQAASGSSGMFLVNGDPDRIEQALLNLVNNAVNYAPGSARIDVGLRRVNSTAEDGTVTPMAEITVRDYGKGIAPEDMSRLFTRFYQVRVSNAEWVKGLGLGLFITRQIVEAHGGTISVASTMGEGTTFAIRLPISAEAE